MKPLYFLLVLFALLTASCDLLKPNDDKGSLKVKVTDRQGNAIEGANIYIVWDELEQTGKFDPPPVDVFVSTQITVEQQVRVFWGCITDPGITGYRVYRSDFSDGSHLQPLGNGAMIEHIPGCVTYEVIDQNVIWGKVYYYYVRTYGTGGADWGLSEPSEAILADPTEGTLPTLWDLSTVNAAFSGAQMLKYSVPVSGRCRMEISGLYYANTFEFFDTYRTVGNYVTLWNGKDYAGTDLPNGIYRADLYSFDPLEQPVLEKSLFLLKNNTALSNLPVAVSTATPLVLPFATFFRFDTQLAFYNPYTEEQGTTSPPYFFSVHVLKDGYEPVYKRMTITSTKREYLAHIELIPE